MQASPVSEVCRPEEAERENIRKVLAGIKNAFDAEPDSLIPMLQYVQDRLGYLPEKALLEIGRYTRVPAASVFGVATFYSQFRLQPTGKHLIRICTGTACHVRGSGRILNEVRKRLGIGPSETTGDRLFTLQTVACFGACALAPVVVVDDSVNGRMNPSRALDVVKALGNGDSHEFLELEQRGQEP